MGCVIRPRALRGTLGARAVASARALRAQPCNRTARARLTNQIRLRPSCLWRSRTRALPLGRTPRGRSPSRQPGSHLPSAKVSITKGGEPGRTLRIPDAARAYTNTILLQIGRFSRGGRVSAPNGPRPPARSFLPRSPAPTQSDPTIRGWRYGEASSGGRLPAVVFADAQPRRSPGWNPQPFTTCVGTSARTGEQPADAGGLAARGSLPEPQESLRLLTRARVSQTRFGSAMGRSAYRPKAQTAASGKPSVQVRD